MTHIGHSEKVLVMRVFIAVLVLIFSLQSWTRAEDITDIEIEGMSIGDSLLNFFSEEEITIKNKKYHYSSKKCYNLRIGSKRELVYHESRNYFYVPGTMTYYCRMLYLSIFAFMLSLIPWELLYNK